MNASSPPGTPPPRTPPPDPPLLGLVAPDVARVLRGLPRGWLDEVDAEDAFLFGPAVAAALADEAGRRPDGTAGGGLWTTLARRCAGGTAFADIRMEAGAGPVCAVASDRVPGVLWFSWLALSALVERPRPVPLLVVLHDVDRRALPLRDALAGWAEAGACLVLAPELPTDPRRPGGDTAYAGEDAGRSAHDVLAVVGELAQRLDVELSRIVVLAVGRGCSVVPHLAAAAGPRLAGAVLVNPGPGLLPGGSAVGRARLPLRLLAGSHDGRRAVDGPPGSSGLQRARAALHELVAAGLDAALEVVPGSAGEVLDQRVEAVPRPARPTLLLQAATRHLDELLARGAPPP
jgi:hypothetical protein